MAGSAIVMVFLAGLGAATASSFLHAKPHRPSDHLEVLDVQQSLISELYSLSHVAELRNIEEELRPMYAALPKNDQSKLEPSIVRYALHRYFVQKHGWYMRGLEPEGLDLNASSLSNITKASAPAFAQSFLEKQLQGGLGLHELAVFAATLSDLIHKEAQSDLGMVFAAMGLPSAGEITRSSADNAIKTYFIAMLLEGMDRLDDQQGLLRDVQNSYPGWQSAYSWLRDLRNTQDLLQQSRRNPFVQSIQTFDTTATFLKEFGHQFGRFQDFECGDLKARLVEHEHGGSGRLPLAKFYADGLSGDWIFTESIGYLRSLGALDETDPKRPSLIIPNYVTSYTNCLSTSGFYSVCCMNECEGLMQQVEGKIATPTATPAVIAGVISSVWSATVDAPRNLSSALLVRLDEVAAVHGGQVPLHGRLFAQWMHHAYPRECPFPHVAGTISPMTQDEWGELHGHNTVDATAEEMKRHQAVSMPELRAEAEEDELLPWIAHEELISKYRPVKQGLPLRSMMIFLALLSFALPLARATFSGAHPSKCCEKHLV